MAPTDHKKFLSVLPFRYFAKSKLHASLHCETMTTMGSCNICMLFTLPASSPFKIGPHHSFTTSRKVNISQLFIAKQCGPSDCQLTAQPLSLTKTTWLFNQSCPPLLMVLHYFVRGKHLAYSPCETMCDIRSTSSSLVFSLFSLQSGPS